MSNLRILVIEDQKPDADVIISRLRRLGYKKIKHCYTALAAIAFIRKEAFDLAVIDKELEDSNIDGVELAKFIKDNTSAPFIFVTGFHDDETTEDIRQTGAVQVVKPASLYQLKVALQHALANRPSELQEGGVLREIADETIFIKLRDRTKQALRYSSIQFVVWSGRIGRIYLSDTVQFEIHMTTGGALSTYFNNELFIKINKGTIVNLLNIKQMKNGELTFMGIKKLKPIPIGKNFVKPLNDAIIKHNIKVMGR